MLGSKRVGRISMSILLVVNLMGHSDLELLLAVANGLKNKLNNNNNNQPVLISGKHSAQVLKSESG